MLLIDDAHFEKMNKDGHNFMKRLMITDSYIFLMHGFMKISA